jgi:hypothetical protein
LAPSTLKPSHLIIRAVLKVTFNDMASRQLFYVT